MVCGLSDMTKTELTVPLNVLKIKKPLDIEIKINGVRPFIDLGVNGDKRRIGSDFRFVIITTAQ